MFKVFTKWMHETATVLFDDTKNDLRALPKTVRLQILIVLSALWSTAFQYLGIYSANVCLWLAW